MINKNDCLKLTNLIDEKYVDEALALKPKKENAVKQKIDKKINFKKPILALLSVAVILAVVVLPIASTIKTPNNTLQNSSGNGGGDEYITDKHYEMPTLDLVYSATETSLMPLVELINISSDLYSQNANGMPDYLIAEYKVIDDYYEKLQKDCIIRVPIHINTVKNSSNRELVDKNKYIEFINAYKRAIIYTRNYNKSAVYYKNGEIEGRVTIENVTTSVSLSESYFPVDDSNVVKYEKVVNFFENNNCGHPFNNIYLFSEFCYEGITLDEMAKNVKKLYESQMYIDSSNAVKQKNGVSIFLDKSVYTIDDKFINCVVNSVSNNEMVFEDKWQLEKYNFETKKYELCEFENKRYSCRNYVLYFNDSLFFELDLSRYGKFFTKGKYRLVIGEFDVFGNTMMKPAPIIDNFVLYCEFIVE